MEEETWLADRKRRSEEKEAYIGLFVESISSEDTTGILIKGHLYVENELTKLLRAYLPNHAEIDLKSFSYARKLDLVYGLGAIAADEYHAYMQFNRVRNSLAHADVENRALDVTTADVKRIWDSIGSEMRDVYELVFDPIDNDVRETLRAIVASFVGNLFAWVDAAQSENVRYDLYRANVMNETVQQRMITARLGEARDSDAVRAVKDGIKSLSDDDKYNLRIWMRETYHHL